MRLAKTVKMVGLDVFLPELLMSAPALPSDIAASYIRQAAIDLAEQSNCLRRQIIVESQAGCSDYLLEPPDCTRTNKIVRVCDARGNEYFVDSRAPCAPPCAVSCIDACCSGDWFPMSTLRVWFEQPNVFNVLPTPRVDLDLGFTVEISVVPDRDACEVDELLYQRYSPTIVAGALSYLHLQPGQPWSNPGLSKANKDTFKIGSARALGDVLLGASSGAKRMTTRRIV
jgi:hypothetical protein